MTVRGLVSLVAGGLLAGCATLPEVNRVRQVEVKQVVRAIECELAAAAADPALPNFDGATWGAKSALDLTLVDSYGADGRVAWTLPVAVTGVTLTPSLGLQNQKTSNAHLDFYTDIPTVKLRHPGCRPGPDPSDTGLGLAAWLTTTLNALRSQPQDHAGLSYTIEFQVTVNGNARFGYSIVPVVAEFGAGGTHVGTHRLTVAVAPKPKAAQPVEVVIVGDRTARPKPGEPGRATMGVEPAPARPVMRRRGSVPPAPRDNPTLDSLILRQAPVRLQPGTLTPRL
ncbi:MAG: hypothetical protein HZA68_10070 [Rhodovulum sp.]|nr:hypothetical protein [Rhodovulum sp.]